MTKKKSTQSKKAVEKKTIKKSNIPLIIIAAAVVMAAALAMLFGNSSENSAPSGEAQAISAGGFLAIPTAEIGSTALFFPVEVDGTAMEVLAVRASDGAVRTAFNTCQSCYTSGAGYYVQEGGDLVCQNCGFHFTPDQVEIQSGGCNPWPIFPENKTETADSIQISYEFLKESSSIFANWKR